MAEVNLYDVLEVKEDCSTKDIKLAYRDLVKVYHPDKATGDKDMFELITHAYNILVNPKTRSEYDDIYALSKQTDEDHFSMRTKAKNYAKAQETSTVNKSKEELKMEFESAFDEFDRKHGLERDLGQHEIDSREANRMYQDLRTAREQDEIEYSHDPIFDHGRFDLDKFNAAFDAQKDGINEIVPHSGNPMAFNEIGGMDSNYTPLDNLGDLYIDDNDPGNGAYSNVNFDAGKRKRLTRKDIENLQGAKYTQEHNYIESDYEKMMKERLKERESMSKQLDTRSMNDFSTDPTCGGYGIFNSLGVQNFSTINWQGTEDLKSRYERLLEMRRNEDQGDSSSRD